MSWSTRKIVIPASTISTQPTPELLRLGRVEPGGGLVHADEPRPCGQRARRAHELALTLTDLVRHAVRRGRWMPSTSSANSTLRAVATALRHDEVGEEAARPTGVSAATCRFSSMLRSSNSSSDCHVRPRPRRARRCAGSCEISSPRNLMLPVVGTKPVMPSMKVVFPAPFGPMSPTSWPSSTVKSTASTARRPPKRHASCRSCRSSSITPPLRAGASAGERPGVPGLRGRNRARSCSPSLRRPPAIPSGFRIAERMSAEPAEHERELGRDAERCLQEGEHETARDEEPADHRAR